MSNYRLTTRGKIVVTLLLAIVVIISFSLVSGEEKPGDEADAAETIRTELPARQPDAAETPEKPTVEEETIDLPDEEEAEEATEASEPALPPFEQKRILVRFGPDDAALQTSEANRLQAFLAEAEAVPWMIRIDSHINGYPDYNDSAFGKQLSRERGEVVARFLIAAGIDEERLILYSHGSAEPIHESPTDEELARNRRTEVQFVFQTVDKPAE